MLRIVFTTTKPGVHLPVFEGVSLSYTALDLIYDIRHLAAQVDAPVEAIITDLCDAAESTDAREARIQAFYARSTCAGEEGAA